MNANTNADSTAYTRLIDDLLWLHARGHSNDGLREAVDAMIAEYTANPDHYSDGSPIGAQYIPDYAPNVIAWEPFPPPHRRTAETDTSSTTTTFERDEASDSAGSGRGGRAVRAHGGHPARDRGGVMGEFVNFFGLDEASLALCEAAVAEAPPLSPKQVDIIATLFGWTPVDIED